MFLALRDQIDQPLNELLAFTAGRSEAARAYYLARAEGHDAPMGCGFLYVAAAAVHCDGTCGPAHATQIHLASLPYARPPTADVSSGLLSGRVRSAVVRAVCNPSGPGCGTVVCTCRTMLLEVLTSAATWPSQLLKSTPTAPIELAGQDAQCQQRRCVIAQVISGNKRAAHATGMHIHTVWSETKQEHTVYLTVAADEKPTRKRYILGFACQSSGALANLSVAAQLWVDSDAAWDLKVVSNSFFETKPTVCTFKRDSTDGHGWSSASLPRKLLQLGYEKVDAGCLLVYAVVEDVDMGH